MAYSSLTQDSCDEIAVQTTSRTGRRLPKTDGIRHAKRNIILAMLSVSVPLLILGGILAGLVQRYRLDQSDEWFTSVEYRDAKSDSSAFYLNMSATRFVTVASWISNVAASLSGLIMLIFSYQVAHNFLHASKDKNSHKHCPTPFQLNLFLQARAGGITSIWEIIKYSTWEERANAGFMLTRTTAVLLITLILSYAIWGIDTWLHVSTTATLLTQRLEDPAAYHNYSREISCNTTQMTYGSCSTNSHGMALVTDAFQILNNMSAYHMVSTYQDKAQTFAYVTDARIERGHSFAASTLAINTQCTPVWPPSCDVGIGPDESESFIIWGTECDRFSSQVVAPGALAGMNSSIVWLDQPDIASATPIPHATSNPFYFAVQTVSGSFNTQLSDHNDSRMWNLNDHEFIGYTINCISTVYDIQYRWVNGSFLDVTSSVMASGVLGNTFSAPFQTGVGLSTVSNAAATALGMPTMSLLADTFSTVFSKTAMSLGASIAASSANLGEAEIVTGARVPKKSLFALLSVILLYALWGILLGSLALLSRNPDVDDVQARLTIAGVTAECFEKSSAGRPMECTEGMFAEPITGRDSVRLRMVRSKDLDNAQWRYVEHVSNQGIN